MSTAAAKTTGGAPRSAVEVASGKKVHECHLLADACCFPKGPIQGKDKHVEEAVKMWARDCTKGGGGHGIRKAGPTFAKSRARTPPLSLFTLALRVLVQFHNFLAFSFFVGASVLCACAAVHLGSCLHLAHTVCWM